MNLRRDHLWDALTLALILLLVAAHLRFAMLDQRLPQNINHSYGVISHLHDLLSNEGGLTQALRTAALDIAGWYNLLITVCVKVFGRTPLVLHFFDILWLALVLVGTALIARRLWGPVAAFAAVALIPPDGHDIVIMARLSCIHIPELALLLGVLVPLVYDQRLSRWSTAVVVGLAGAGALSIRLSSLIWMGTLLPLLLLCALPRPGRHKTLKKLGVILAFWALAIPPLWVWMQEYIREKISHRTSHHGDLSLELFLGNFTSDLGRWVFGLGLVCILVAVARWRPRAWRFLPVLLCWLLVPSLLFLLFIAGTQDFPMYYVAFALLAAGGLSRLPRAFRPLLLLLLLLWCPYYIAQWLPESTARSLSSVVRYGARHERDSIINPFRVYDGIRPAHFRALLQATCPKDGATRCRVYINQGLFTPQPLDFASSTTGLFFLGQRDVQVRKIPDPEDMPPDPPHALASFFCASFDGHLPPDLARMNRRSRDFIREHRFRTVWRMQVDAQCEYVWSTPDGTVRRPDKLRGLPRWQR